jgi:hypothetical protein
VSDRDYEFKTFVSLAQGEQVVFWPVFARPGRQRGTRLRFGNMRGAAVYAMRLDGRYRRYVRARRMSAVWGCVLGVGMHALAIALGLLVWWLLVGR